MDEKDLNQIYEYMLSIRRQLHEYPETGFDLPKTVETVVGELSAMGITPMFHYGEGSVVAQLGQGETTIALRADMDALPVREETDLPYASKIPGQMHACGHDAHTAILLGVAKYLKQREHLLPCQVRLIFQPSEECAVSGAALLVKNGVMEGVDQVLAAHCENELETGLLGVCAGDYMAACAPLTIEFFGRTSHATVPQAGIDAIRMATEAYAALEQAVMVEAGSSPYIWSVGKFSGGQAHNVIADYCRLDISFRFYDMDFARRMEAETQRICHGIAEKYGGRVAIDWKISTGAVHNNPQLAAAFQASGEKSGLDIRPLTPKMSSEDFGWYLTKAPGLLFRFGTRNEALGCTAPAHRNDFTIDEAGMEYAFLAFTAYVLNFKST